jgi:hypothetical protein
MGDGWDHHKKQQQQSQFEKAFPDFAETPQLAYFREGDETGAELCVVIGSKCHSIPIKPAHLAHMLKDGAGLLSRQIQRKR